MVFRVPCSSAASSSSARSFAWILPISDSMRASASLTAAGSDWPDDIDSVAERDQSLVQRLNRSRGRVGETCDVGVGILKSLPGVVERLLQRIQLLQVPPLPHRLGVGLTESLVNIIHYVHVSLPTLR